MSDQVLNDKGSCLEKSHGTMTSLGVCQAAVVQTDTMLA